jgi:hypothetical protein
VNVDWRNLTPDRPLSPEDQRYVERPDDGGARIAEWLRAGRDRILLAGPTGIGKSTELARAAACLHDDRVACLVPLDRLEDIRRLTPDLALLRMAGRLAALALEHLRLDVSPGLRHALVTRGVLDPMHDTGGADVAADPPTLLTLAVREVSRCARQGRVAFLVDGLEKLAPEAGPAVFAALASLPDGAEVAASVPWHAAYGPGAGATLLSKWKLVVLRPVPVEGLPGNSRGGVHFMGTLLARRLGLADDAFHITAAALKSKHVPVVVRRVVLRAASLSGGIPRTFLQIVGDAVSYVRFRGGPQGETVWPDEESLEAAILDQEDSLRRLLLPGDLVGLRAVDGTGGEEMDVERRLRLLTQGILMERSAGGRAVLRPHPLLRNLLKRKPADG